MSVPRITGSVKVGKRLTADPGAWGPGDVALSYQWYRSGAKIAKATKATACANRWPTSAGTSP